MNRNRRSALMAIVAARPPWMERPHPLSQVGKAVLLILLAAVVIVPFMYIV
jgi:putative aldouronate transport system permease protein